MIKTITTRGKLIISLILIVTVCIIYQHYHQPQLATTESQVQAETPQGISLAAHNAHVALLQDQLEQAADQIAELKNKPPEKVIVTVPVEVEKVVIKEVKTSGADFAIVTDPKQPDKKVDLKEITKLPESTPVTLNQYNVFAYKKVLRGVNIYPSFTGITPTGVGEITGDISRKISNDGKYLGVTGGYDFKHKEAKLGLRITF